MVSVAGLSTKIVPVLIIAFGLLLSALTRTSAATVNPTIRVSSSVRSPHVTLSKGDRLVVTLESTYWQIHRPTGQSLRILGSPVSHRMLNCGPLLGSGCGTVIESFIAAASGVSVVSAWRSSCGEALRCSASNATWRVTVRVR